MKPIARRFVIVGGACLVGFIIIECLVRMMPIPGVIKHLEFDPVVGVRLKPGSQVIYCSQKCERVVRTVNADGYLDCEHTKSKPAGTFRIGFFGDSFVEARQVALSDTFFRIIESSLSGFDVECLAFGTAGFGTLHSYLNSQRLIDEYDLDMIVYVFYENDLGDNMQKIKKSPNKPYAVLSGESFTVDRSFEQTSRLRNTPLLRIFNFARNHSYFFALLVHRIEVLATQGFNIREAARSAGVDEGQIGDQSKQLCAAIIKQWNREVVGEGRKFLICYLPTNSEIVGKACDSKVNAWLRDVCEDESIARIDITPSFERAHDVGIALFDDHLTREGHRVLAQTFITWFHDTLVNEK